MIRNRVGVFIAALALAGLSGIGTLSLAEAAEFTDFFTLLIEEQAANVRFSVEDENVTAVRAQVLGLDGRTFFDSGWVNDRFVNWSLGFGATSRKANGVYLYAITVRDRDGQEQRRLGKLALMGEQETSFSVPRIEELAGVEPLAAQFPLPNGTVWRQKIGADRSDTYRVQRKPARLQGGPLTNFENLLQLEADGKLRLKELCLGTIFAPVTNQNPDNLDSGGDCRSSWTDGGDGFASSGWIDDGTTVRLITPSDNVGIGTNNPAQKLHVAGNFMRIDGAGNEQAYIGGDGAGSDVQIGTFNPAINTVGFWNAATGTHMNLFATKVTAQGGVLINSSVGSLTLRFGNADGWNFSTLNGGRDLTFVSLPSGGGQTNRVTFSQSGNVGIGTNVPAQKLHVAGNYIMVNGVANEQAYIGGDGAGSDVQLGTFNAGITNVGLWNAATNTRMNLFAARVVATVGFNGKCRTDGNVANGPTCNQDVAEAFASIEPTEAGDLVVLLPEESATPAVRKSVQPYEGLLVGVVSANPGLVFDHGETYLAGDNSQLITQTKTIVAVVGRVLVKVSMENGTVSAGDPLTSSSTPGAAMKATKAGKIIGYALESTPNDGKVLVWLQPGTYIPGHLLEQLNQLQRN